jgi:hypothetical protein
MCLTLDDQEAGRSYKPCPPLSSAENHILSVLLDFQRWNTTYYQDIARGSYRNINSFDRFAPSKFLVDWFYMYIEHFCRGQWAGVVLQLNLSNFKVSGRAHAFRFLRQGGYTAIARRCSASSSYIIFSPGHVNLTISLAFSTHCGIRLLCYTARRRFRQ